MISQFSYFFDISRIRWRFIYRRECTFPAIYELLMHEYHRSSKSKEINKETKEKSKTHKQTNEQTNKQTNKQRKPHWLFLRRATKCNMFSHSPMTMTHRQTKNALTYEHGKKISR